MQPVPPSAPDSSMIFPSTLGWMAIAWSDDGLVRVRMGYHSRAELEAVIGSVSATPPLWCQRLVERLQAYAAGAEDDFRDVPVAALWLTPFQNDIVAALRAVPYGERTTYGDLAKKAGRRGAARAVGQVMATNPVPLVVPCHRVLASGGKIGGFSAPTGLELKQQLLDLESAGIMKTLAATRSHKKSSSAKVSR